MSNFTRMCLAYQLFPALSQVKSIETLRRHLALAIDYGTNPLAAEYLREIARRESDLDLDAVARREQMEDAA